MRESPTATLRRRRVAFLLEILVFALLSLRGAARLPRALGAGEPPAPVTPPAPLVVDLESDPSTRLELLPGIGPTRAAAIVSERDRGGPFGSADELQRVHGIGPVTVRRIQDAREVRPRFGER